MPKKTAILIFILILKFVLQYVLLSPSYDLQRDEYLHLDQANHLAWGYISVPPLTSWSSYIIKVLGNGFFWVKFFPAVYGCLTIYIVWKMVEELEGGLFALILAASGVLFSAILRLNTLYQPNSLDVLCWTLLLYTLVKYFNTGKTNWLYYSAIVFAIGFLNKYNIIFLILGLLPALALTPQRKIFLQKHLYLAAALALILIAPNLVWQYQNHFPVIHHMKELAATQLVHVERLQFFKSQILFFFGAIVVILCGWLAPLTYSGFQKYRFLFWTFIITLCLFAYLRAKDYYAIGLYPAYIAFGAAWLEHVLNKPWQKYLRVVLILFPVLFFLAMYNVAFPNKSPQYIMSHEETYKKIGLLRWEDGKDHALPQDFSDMLGWRELAEKIDTAYAKLPNPTNTLILCDNYGEAGAINYYTKNRNIHAVSFSADYINWFDLKTTTDNFIRVKEAEGAKDEWGKTKPFFDTGFVAGSITNPLAREYGTTIFVFSKPKIDVNARLRTEINKKKDY